uniref:Uncharacterized protein n=1 Tax=Arundo donax TaxID=35708 RepID=A0A0A9GXK2_ARUDO
MCYRIYMTAVRSLEL